MIRAACLLVGLCALAPPALAQPREVTAALAYRERIALPADAVAVLEVVAAGRVAARQEVALQGRQVPVPVTLTLDPMRLPQDVGVSLRGTLSDGSGQMRWTGSRPLSLAPGGGPTDAGTMFLTRAATPAQAPAAPPRSFTYRCGAEQVQARFDGQAVHLRISGGPEQRLPQVRSASGARFSAGDLAFWDRGAQALLIRRGVTTECTRLDPVAWQARGQEPGWRAALDDTRLVLDLDNGTRRIVAPKPARQERDGVAHLAVRTEAHDIAIEIAQGICRDTMSGVLHPERVTLRIDGQVLQGCGGDPAALLRGAWTVQTIGGKQAAVEKPVTLNFDETGRIHGQGPCNAFNGGYSIGEGLVLTPLASTMRMCEPAAMEREAALHALLQGTVPFDIAADGTLRIGSGATALVARR